MRLLAMSVADSDMDVGVRVSCKPGAVVVSPDVTDAAVDDLTKDDERGELENVGVESASGFVANTARPVGRCCHS
jgi:hypothetical protein